MGKIEIVGLKVGKDLENIAVIDITHIEYIILEAYRELNEIDKEIFYYNIRATAAKTRKKMSESNQLSNEQLFEAIRGI